MSSTPLLDAFAKAQCNAAPLMAEVKAVKPHAEDLAERLQITNSHATKLLSYATYFDYEQLRCMEGLSFDYIFTIGKFCRKLSNRKVDPTEFFDCAVTYAQTATLDELIEHLRQAVTAHNTEQADKPRVDWARFSATPDCDGKSYLNIKAPAEDLARIRSLIDDEAKELFHQGHAHSIAEAYAHIITRSVIGFHEAEQHDPNPLGFKYRPFVSICHPLFLENHDGKYVTTDGTLVDLSEYADQMLEPFGWAVVPYRNTEGMIEYSEPIEIAALDAEDNRDPQRQANPAQRLVLTNAHPMCAHPDCRITARFCQMHHIISWASGGPTEVSNMVPLCMRHNKLNDDNPDEPKNGRIEKDPATGRVGHRRYPDSDLRFSRARTVKYGIFEQARAFFDRLDAATPLDDAA